MTDSRTASGALERYTHYQPVPGRKLSRALARAEAASCLAKQADQLKVERIAEAAARGQAAIANVSAMEALLAQSVPHAEPRLRAIGDSAAAGIVHVVYQAGL
jgi:hypothetical protein